MRRHRHVLEQGLPDVAGEQPLARAASRGRPYSRTSAAASAPSRRLRPREALDEPRQAVRVAAADDPLEQAPVLGDTSSVGLPAETARAGCASRSRSRCVTPSRWRYFTAW